MKILFKDLKVGDIIHQPFSNGWNAYIIISKKEDSVLVCDLTIDEYVGKAIGRREIDDDIWDATINSYSLYYDELERRFQMFEWIFK
jgi:hypothetical protein